MNDEYEFNSTYQHKIKTNEIDTVKFNRIKHIFPVSFIVRNYAARSISVSTT